MAEGKNLKEIWLAAASVGFTLFRNNVGTAWRSKLGPKGEKRRPDGSLLILEPYPVKFGLFKGSSDLIGYKMVTVTPDMVGKSLPVFAGVEVKTAIGTLRKEQKQWQQQMHAVGAVSLVARSADDVLQYRFDIDGSIDRE